MPLNVVPRSDHMADFTSQHVATSKRLFLSVSAAAVIMQKELSEKYVFFGIRRGFFRRGMSNEVKEKTNVEIWAYLSALMVSMVETWPSRPPASDLNVIIQILEGALLVAQRINCRWEYDAYRHYFREGRGSSGVPFPKVCGPMYGLHSEFTSRIGLLWVVPSRASISPYSPEEMFGKADQVMRAYMELVYRLNNIVEEGFRKGLQEVLPA